MLSVVRVQSGDATAVADAGAGIQDFKIPEPAAVRRLGTRPRSETWKSAERLHVLHEGDGRNGTTG